MPFSVLHIWVEKSLPPPEYDRLAYLRFFSFTFSARPFCKILTGRTGIDLKKLSINQKHSSFLPVNNGGKTKKRKQNLAPTSVLTFFPRSHLCLQMPAKHPKPKSFLVASLLFVQPSHHPPFSGPPPPPPKIYIHFLLPLYEQTSQAQPG